MGIKEITNAAKYPVVLPNLGNVLDKLYIPDAIVGKP